MSQLSEDSSDSSNDYFLPVDKIDLKSLVFNQPSEKYSQKPSTFEKTRIIKSESDDSEDDIDYLNENNVSSAELLSQVLKNLQNLKSYTLLDKCTNTHQTASTSQEVNPHLSNTKDEYLSQEINNLLSQGETQIIFNKEDHNNDGKKSVSNIQNSNQGVEIYFPGQNSDLDKKKKKQKDLQRILQNKINQRIRSSQLYMHKVSLLCWISHGFHLNFLANDPDVLAFAISLVQLNKYPKEKADLNYLKQFIKWFSELFKINEEFKEVKYSKESLLQRINNRTIYNYAELVLICIATFRGMGLNSRLVMSLQPLPLKPKPEQLFKVFQNRNSSIKMKKKSVESEKNENKVELQKKLTSEKVITKKVSVRKNSPVKNVKNTRAADLAANEMTKKKIALFLKQFKATPSKNNKSFNNKHSPEAKKLFKDRNSSDDKNYCKGLKIKKLAETPIQNKNDTNINQIDYSEVKNLQPNCEKIRTTKSEYSLKENYTEKKLKKKICTHDTNDKVNIKLLSSVKNQRQLLSSDEDDMFVNKKMHNIWIEVYSEAEEKWICIDILRKKINCASDIYKKAEQPVLYILAWNAANQLKDVSRRYCPNWLTDTRKKRVDEKWWSFTLSSWKEKNTLISRSEDEELLRKELEQPLPKTVSECKGHPLYAIARHLLKFEAFYPPNCVPLGHLKTGEAIYSRHCVHTLMSRETWARKARIVKPTQEPYKIVKSMPKLDKLSGTKIKDQPLELFGKWQTDPYIPPEAKDGKVPRNEYGNVDLFKMSMLPKGTVWINLPALNRVARKLNIDCAPACIGFNFGCRGALPAFEGFVVCAEYEDTLRDAWEREQIEAEKRNKEKREKRIYGNWRKLIKGLLIKMKLAAKYKFNVNEEDTQDQKARNVEEDIIILQKRAMEKKTISASNKSIKRKKDEPKNVKKRVKR